MTTHLRYDDEDQGIFTNKSTMMANFEEWIKMATDNKINSRNSWNFALIDYFHDLNVLKDAEDNINFQKASATLDGCIKIYSSRVDSVASETGKLLSGLAQRRNKDSNGDNSNGEKDEVDKDEIEIDPVTGMLISKDNVNEAKKRRNYNRVLETTLVQFDTIKIKELDQELTIDPLFKKALADFDEGGAKSLLVNTLDVDENLRVVFDANATDMDGSKQSNTFQANEEKVAADLIDDSNPDLGRSNSDNESPAKVSAELEESDTSETSVSIDSMTSYSVEDEILALGIKFLSFDQISTSDICPSMSQLKAAVQDIDRAKTFIEDVNNKFDNFLTEQDMQEAIPETLGVNDTDEFYELPGQDDEVFNDDNTDLNKTTPDNENTESNFINNIMDQELLAYFDNFFKKSWRGREHWKVHNYKHKLRIHKENQENPDDVKNSKDSSGGEEKEAKKKNKKENSFIDFFDLEGNIEETIFAVSKTLIEIPQKHREDESHHILPNDYQFSADRITRLFIKPDQRMSFFSLKKQNPHGHKDADVVQFQNTEAGQNGGRYEIADEKFWAENYKMKDQSAAAPTCSQLSTDNNPNLDLSPTFEDDCGIDFNQAFEGGDPHESDGYEDEEDAQECIPATQNIIKTEDKVTFSRTAKKVDVRRLKNNIWKSITSRIGQQPTPLPTKENQPTYSNTTDLKFTDIATDIFKMYSEKTRKDLSTSFCFICLLHLANEHGFSITQTDDHKDLFIQFQQEDTA
ncbi:condensin subunit BRN1 Ecym_7124 [Eremothecium cymbalariae DBVPG|uniref:Condensin complex subunit 2 n=1 Tax=Eremothecium cymbalariae (strain CBS 270.75 / DBVPG 7215 / KCTC 17166 / NRRL Y-17582) TaxID=931890 RepID=G8JVV9_ERECY|nr:hypothetical protein Ecym_7124 [Eremothecium cymbalariae DBVPG\